MFDDRQAALPAPRERGINRVAQGKKYYFEDFIPGSTWEIQGPTLSKEDIVEFAAKYDPQYFHVDAERAKHSAYGGLIASGWQTVSLCMRMTCDCYLLESASLGSPGVDKVRWKQPVRPGDSLRMRVTVLKATASRTKPDRGTLLSLWEVFNQRNELVMTMEGYGILARRSADPDHSSS
ncbi:MAG: MaoC family dehydratase [Betaproteobacteria bacterium]|nr:MaoC family dehydratase [Betaproteobacteria bacterium]